MWVAIRDYVCFGLLVAVVAFALWVDHLYHKSVADNAKITELSKTVDTLNDYINKSDEWKKTQEKGKDDEIQTIHKDTHDAPVAGVLHDAVKRLPKYSDVAPR